MTQILKSSFLWQFAGGFMLGAIGLFTLHPGDRDLTAERGAPVADVR